MCISFILTNELASCSVDIIYYHYSSDFHYKSCNILFIKVTKYSCIKRLMRKRLLILKEFEKHNIAIIRVKLSISVAI